MSQLPSSPVGLSAYTNRRGFMRTSAITGTGLYLATSKTAIAQETQPNRRIKCALVGCGIQGNVLRNASKSVDGIQWVACCDIWTDVNLKRTVGIMRAENKHQVEGEIKAYGTIEEMLEKQTDIEAVFIATPDFLHAPFSRLCLAKGKAVYCEKMMSNTIEGAKDMVRAGREYNQIFQIGHQRHSNPRYLNLRDNIIRGENLLGRITHAYGQWNRGVSASKLLSYKGTPLSQEILSKYGYTNFDEFLNWRWYKKYGAGPLSDLGAHQIDMFNWMFGELPESVYATGDVDYYDGTNGKPKFELADNAMCIYEYKLKEGKTRAYYQVLTTTGSQGFYEKYMGIQGSALISEMPSYNSVYQEPDTGDWGTSKASAQGNITQVGLKNKFWERDRTWDKPKPKTYMAALADSRNSKALNEFQLGAQLRSSDYPHSPHVRNFIEAVQRKDPKHLNCNVEEAFRSCVTVLKAYDSMKTGTKLMFTPEDFTV